VPYPTHNQMETPFFVECPASRESNEKFTHLLHSMLPRWSYRCRRMRILGSPTFLTPQTIWNLRICTQHYIWLVLLH